MNRLILAFLFLLLASAARSDEVHLKNGNIHRGTIITITDTKVVFNVLMGNSPANNPKSYVRMEIQNRRIKKVVRTNSETTSQPKKEPAVSVTPKTKQQPALTPPKPTVKTSVAPTSTDISTLQLPQLELDPTMQTQIRFQLNNLVHKKPSLREKAAQQLRAMGDLAMPQLLNACYAQPALQIEAIALLGKMKRKDSVQMLISFLSRPDSEWKTMDAAYLALLDITGQSLAFEPKQAIPVRKKQAAAWERWFQLSRMQYPKQYGIFSSSGKGLSH